MSTSPTWSDLQRWVTSAEPESDVLDFKQLFWPEKQGRERSEEIAKDLAAFMNHAGGVIVVGIADAGDRASGFSTAPLPSNAEQIIQQAAIRHIVPGEAAAGVHTFRLRGVDGTTEREVVVVEVDAWPHGPVAVRVGDALLAYRLPVRHGTHTVELSWEEAMRRMDGAKRRMWLRFREWRAKNSIIGITIGTRIVMKTGDRIVEVPLPPDEAFATLGTVDQDVVQVQIIRSNYVKWLGGNAPILDTMARGVEPESPFQVLLAVFQLAGAQQTWNETAQTFPVAVPFELIRVAWWDVQCNAPRMHLFLDADILFTGSSWVLRPVRSPMG